MQIIHTMIGCSSFYCFIPSAHFIFDVKLCFEVPAFNCTISMQNLSSLLNILHQRQSDWTNTDIDADPAVNNSEKSLYKTVVPLLPLRRF